MHVDMIESKTWIDLVIQTYMDGGSDVEVCKAIKTTPQKFNQKYKEDQKFAELVDYGRMLSTAWWMEQARFAIKDKTFNTAMWQFVMKNRFGWADKTENLERLPDHMTDLDSLKAKLNEVLPGIIKQLNPNVMDATLLKEFRKGSN